MTSLWIIFYSVLGAFALSRLVTLAVLHWKILPRDILSNNSRWRVHHFVYGNVLIIIAAFVVIGFGVDASQWWVALLFGAGLGLILDEFPHWKGDVEELTRNVLFMREAAIAVVLGEMIILGLILGQWLAG